VGSTGDRYNGVVFPGEGFTDAAKGRFPIATSGELIACFVACPRNTQRSTRAISNLDSALHYSLNEKTVVRAGVGRFMTRLGVSDSIFLGGNPPFQPTSSVTNGSVDAPGGASAVNFPLILTSQDPIYRNPTAYAWNVTFEREIGFQTTVEVGYVGRRGLGNLRERNINQLALNTCPNGSCPLIDPTGPSSGPRTNVDFLRPFKGFGTIRVTNTDATSWYNGLQIGVNRRFVNGFSYGVAYTYAKSEDDTSSRAMYFPMLLMRAHCGDRPPLITVTPWW